MRCFVDLEAAMKGSHAGAPTTNCVHHQMMRCDRIDISWPVGLMRALEYCFIHYCILLHEHARPFP